MTTASAAGTGLLRTSAVADVVRLLESDFAARPRSEGTVVNQVLLDALDRGERQRFMVWPAERPRAVLYVSSSGTLVPAGDPAGGPALAEGAERTGWRVLVGDAPISEALLDAYPRALFRRRPHARRQRLMAVSMTDVHEAPPVTGLRQGTMSDLEPLTEMACRLHVEDRMGPPIARANRPAVRSRMADSVSRRLTFVVEREGAVVGKLDLSLRSLSRGAQIAGVYVFDGWRGRGIASEACRAVAADLLAEGLPCVTLHVRADNDPAIAAYRRAGFTERAQWLLALR